MPLDWPNIGLAAARMVHFGSCLLCMTVWMFDRVIVRDDPAAAAWPRTARRICAISLLVALVSGALWFVMLAEVLGAWNLASILWSRTTIGTLWHWRLAIWIAAVVTAAAASRIQIMRLPALAAAAALVASLAWAGHGIEPVQWHLVADVIHLLAAGCWPAGLVPLLLILRAVGRTDPAALPKFVRRFSAMSIISVATLTATGLVNSYYLVGTPGNLFTTLYGRVLLVKLVLFVGTAGIGAANLLKVNPQSRRLRGNVAIELSFTTLIILIVAILGRLAPAV